MSVDKKLIDRNYTLGLYDEVKKRSNEETNSFIVLSNNDKIITQFKNSIAVEGDYIDVLYKARELILKGHKLLSHPMGASIRIILSPIRSLLLSEETGEFDENSLKVLEEGIEKYKATLGKRSSDMRNKKDYEVIDYDLLLSAIEENDFISKLLKN